MDSDSVIIHIKTEDFHKDIGNNAGKDSIHRIKKLMDHYLQERIKK